MSTLRLGVLGMSDGNGHPYSWSAIFNGYDDHHMKDCPFPVIPGYLSKQQFPADGLGHLAIVTHVWTQERSISEQIAAASKIANVVNRPEEMIGDIDAVLLARDDAENHYEMALPFLKAGIPVFIDKPFALKVREAEKMWAAQQRAEQIFSCSSLRYAPELLLSAEDREAIGEIKMVEGSIMKKWETYGIHILEPIVAQLQERGKLLAVKAIGNSTQRQVLIQWENVSAYLKTTGDTPSPLELKFFGTKGTVIKTFHDSFTAFKNSLAAFISVVQDPLKNIARNETLELVTILEKGAA